METLDNQRSTVLCGRTLTQDHLMPEPIIFAFTLNTSY